MVQNVFWNPTEGAAQFTFSSTGVLTYLRGGPEVAKYTIASVDRRGGTTKLIEEAGSYANPRLSPDGKRLSLTVLKDGNFDIWVYDLERGVPTRLTFDDAPETEQVWSPDGRFLAFSSGRAGADNLYRKRADGSGEEERLTTSDNPMWPNSWSARWPLDCHCRHGPQRQLRRDDAVAGGQEGRAAAQLELPGGRSRPSRPIAAGWRTARTSPDASRSTSARIPPAPADGRSPTTAGPSRGGPATGASCSTGWTMG